MAPVASYCTTTIEAILLAFFNSLYIVRPIMVSRYASPFQTIVLLLLTAASAIAQQSSWQGVGIGGGRPIVAISINRNNTNHVVISTDAGASFQTKNFGVSWGSIPYTTYATRNTQGIRFINNSRRCYALINDASQSGVPSVSTDGGEHWSRIPGSPTQLALALHVHPDRPNVVLIADNTKLYSSTDSGTTFTTRHTVTTSPYLHIAGTFFSGDSIWVCTGTDMVTSTDGGKTFTIKAHTGIPTSERIASFAAAKENGAIRFMAIALVRQSVQAGMSSSAYTNFKNVYTRTVADAAWSTTLGQIPDGIRPFHIAMAQNNTNVVYVAGGSAAGVPTVMKSTNGGQTWGDVFTVDGNTNIATGWLGDSGERPWSDAGYAVSFAISAINPNIIAMADRFAAHISNDGGKTWRQAYLDTATQNNIRQTTQQGKSYASNGLEIADAQWICWADSLNVVAGFINNKALFSRDGGKQWVAITNLAGFTTMHHIVSNPFTGKLYAAVSTIDAVDCYTAQCIDNKKGAILESSDKGKTWKLLRDFGRPVVSLTIDPKSANTMYACVQHGTDGAIWSTIELQKGSAAVWQKLPSNPTRTQGHPARLLALEDGALVAVYSARDQKNNGTLTQTSGVFITYNGGITWEDRTGPTMVFYTRDVVIDPSDPQQNTWYGVVTTSWTLNGSKYEDEAGIYITRDRGLTWTAAFQTGTTAGRGYPLSLVINPNNNTEVYVAFQRDGLWRSTNLALGEFASVRGYPIKRPERIFPHPYRIDELWVTNFSGGILRGNLSSLPAQPTLTAPANNSTGTARKGIFQWNTATNGTTYRLQLSQNPDMSAPIVDQTDITVTSFPYDSLGLTATYYWRVQTINEWGSSEWSDTWTFTTNNKPLTAPAPPTLRLPLNGATDVPLLAILQWDTTSTTTSVYVQVAEDSTFTTLIFVNDIRSTVVGTTELKAGMRYWWRVQSVNDVGRSSWSETWSFTTATNKPTVPAAPALLAPPNGATNVAPTDALTWSIISNATSYQAQLSSTNDFASPLIDKRDLAVPTQVFVSLGEGEEYFWRVRTINDVGTGPWSEIWKFRVRGEISGADAEQQHRQSVWISLNRTEGTQLHYRNTQPGSVVITIWDAAGKIHRNISTNAGIGEHIVPLNDLPTGIYFCQVSAQGKSSVTQAIVVE